jgi:hypothetical protein
MYVGKVHGRMSDGKQHGSVLMGEGHVCVRHKWVRSARHVRVRDARHIGKGKGCKACG